MQIKEFKNLVMNRQACRNFINKDIDKDILLQIVDTARFAPSACNSQPWKMYCVSEPSVREKVLEALQEGGRNAFLSNAAAFIVLSESLGTLKQDVLKRYAANHFVKYDIGELAAYVTLTAKSLGVDSCIIGWMNHEKLGTALSFTEGESCNIVVALGYSEIPTREKDRKPFEQSVKLILE